MENKSPRDNRAALSDPTRSRFDTIGQPACDRQTDRHTTTAYTARCKNNPPSCARVLLLILILFRVLLAIALQLEMRVRTFDTCN